MRVQIGAERAEHLLYVVEVVVRPLGHVLIQRNAAMPRMDAGVGTCVGREHPQPGEVACAFPSPCAKEDLHVLVRRNRRCWWLDHQAILCRQAVQPRRVDVALGDEQVGQDLTRRPGISLDADVGDLKNRVSKLGIGGL